MINKNNIPGESWYYKNKDVVNTKIFLNAHETFLIYTALQKANIDIPIIVKTQKDNENIIRYITEEWTKISEENKQMANKIVNNIKKHQEFLKSHNLKKGLK